MSSNYGPDHTSPTLVLLFLHGYRRGNITQEKQGTTRKQYSNADQCGRQINVNTNFPVS